MADLMDPLVTEADSIVFHISRMNTVQFYTAVLKGKPYLYCKLSETEVEVYGLAD